MYMHLTAKVTRTPRANFHCNSLTTVQDIQDYASLIFSGAQCTCAIQRGNINNILTVRYNFADENQHRNKTKYLRPIEKSTVSAQHMLHNKFLTEHY